jgi:hypothetical protein
MSGAYVERVSGVAQVCDFPTVLCTIFIQSSPCQAVPGRHRVRLCGQSQIAARIGGLET